jgi:hypothetical protein
LPETFDFRAVVEAWLLLWACRVGLWTAPFPRVLRGARFCAERLRSRRPTDAGRVVNAVHRALPLTLRASCLTQALAGWIMLTRHGAEGRIRIGVASGEKDGPQPGGFKAHAWLEAEGRVILGDLEDVDGDGGLDPFHVIWTLPPEKGMG